MPDFRGWGRAPGAPPLDPPMTLYKVDSILIVEYDQLFN